MLRKLFLGACLTILTLTLGLAVPPAFAEDLGGQGDLLETIKTRGYLICGVRTPNLPGFAEQLPNGKWVGHDVDYCRAVAAAILGDEKAVEFVGATGANRFELLRDGVIDLLVRVTTHTLSRDAAYDTGGEGGDFAPVIFYDGQGFLSDITGGADITTNAALASALNDRVVCVSGGTTTQLNLRDFASENGITIYEFETSDVISDYNSWNCDFATGDRSALFTSLPGVTRPDSIVFTKTISEEPLAPVVRMGGESERFEDVVRWVVYATFLAEERGINKKNVKKKKKQHPDLNSEERRLLGIEGGLGEKLGLDNDWAFDVIRLVGSHEDIYQRHLSALPAGDNQPPPNGLLFSPPFR